MDDGNILIRALDYILHKIFAERLGIIRKCSYLCAQNT